MTSVRESLNVVGQSVSIHKWHPSARHVPALVARTSSGLPRQAVCFESDLVGLFPAQVRRVFQSASPDRYSKFALDSKERKFGQSALTVAVLDPVAMSDPNRAEYDHDHPSCLRNSRGPGEVFELPWARAILEHHRFYFHDVNSDGSRSTVVPGQLVGIEIAIPFETKEETYRNKVEDFIMLTTLISMCSISN